MDPLQIAVKNFDGIATHKQKLADFIDKWILTASLGSFGLSFAFIKQLNEQVKALCLMDLAWIGFIATVITNLTCSMILVIYDDKSCQIINSHLSRGQVPPNEEDYPCRTRIIKYIAHFLNYFSILLFISSLVLSLIFGILNMKNQTSTKQNLTEIVIN